MVEYVDDGANENGTTRRKNDVLVGDKKGLAVRTTVLATTKGIAVTASRQISYSRRFFLNPFFFAIAIVHSLVSVSFC